MVPDGGGALSARESARVLARERKDGYGPDGEWVGVVAFDPGKTTGVAWMRARVAVLRNEGWLPTLKARQMLGGLDGGTGEVDCTDIVEGVRRLMAAVKQVGAGVRRVVVCEDFSLYAGKMHLGKAGLWSPRVAAALEVALKLGDGDEYWQTAVDTWAWQMASEFRSVTNERLEQWGVYVPGDHARDALRHLITWLRKQKW